MMALFEVRSRLDFGGEKFLLLRDSSGFSRPLVGCLAGRQLGFWRSESLVLWAFRWRVDLFGCQVAAGCDLYSIGKMIVAFTGSG